MPVEPFYLPVGADLFQPTRATESPWDTSAQHGGPPSALLAHLAAAAGDPSRRPVRVSVDFLGPLPRRAGEVTVRRIRPGRAIELTEATLRMDDRAAAVARVWCLATGPRPPVVSAAEPAPPLPTRTTPVFPQLTDWGYGEALDWRYTAGSPDTPGPAAVWTRVRPALLPDRPLTGVDRVLIAADAANGLSAELPIDRWLSIPTGLTVHLMRDPVGEWIHLDCSTRIAADGIGLCTGRIADAEGYLGELTQPLVVRVR